MVYCFCKKSGEGSSQPYRLVNIGDSFRDREKLEAVQVFQTRADGNIQTVAKTIAESAVLSN